jgi:hypothetical protein
MGRRRVREGIPGAASSCLQGYLAHKKTPHTGTLYWAYAYGPMTVLRGRGRVLVIEVMLYALDKETRGPLPGVAGSV